MQTSFFIELTLYFPRKPVLICYYLKMWRCCQYIMMCIFMSISIVVLSSSGQAAILLLLPIYIYNGNSYEWIIFSLD